MDRRTVGLTAFAAASAVLAVSWAANTWTVQVHAVYPAALCLMAGSGLANGMAAGQWHARDRFAIPGMTWSLRLLPLVIWWVRGAGPHDLPLLALGIGMADGLRCAILLRGVDSRQPDIRAVALPVRAICRTYGIVVLTALIGGVNPIIDRMIATLSGPGGVSVLEAGERIYMVLAGVSTMGIGMVLLTRLSRFAADGTLSHHWPALLRFLGQWIGLWTAVGALAGFLGLRWWLESAAAMDPGQNHAAVAVYGWYLAGLPFFALAMAYVRRLQAQQRWWIMVLTSSVTVALNIPLSLILRQQMGVPGIALATTIIHGVNCMILMAAAHCHRETS